MKATLFILLLSLVTSCAHYPDNYSDQFITGLGMMVNDMDQQHYQRRQFNHAVEQQRLGSQRSPSQFCDANCRYQRLQYQQQLNMIYQQQLLSPTGF